VLFDGLFMDNITIDDISNIESIVKSQRAKFNHIRKQVKKLTFNPIDSSDSYSSITFKAVDGGMMGINLSPFEVDIIEIADSNGNVKMKFAVPSNEDMKNYDFSDIDNKKEMKQFLGLLKLSTIKEASEILKDSGTYMEIGEWACIFDKMLNNTEDNLIILKDGLLRSKKLRDEHIPILIENLKVIKNRNKLVGVAKSSEILNLISFALRVEKIFPSGSIGYVKIPPDLEAQAYTWSGKGEIDTSNPKLYFAFGDLYVAKLSKNSDLCVTVEIPKDIKTGEQIYTQSEIDSIFGHLAKDSMFSYPILGYPQSIMKAHETAVRIGFPAELIRDLIIQRLTEGLDNEAKEAIRDAWLIKNTVEKGMLGGGA
jgi:hypothetical protein